MEGAEGVRVKVCKQVVPQDGGDVSFDAVAWLRQVQHWKCIPQVDHSIKVEVASG